MVWMDVVYFRERCGWCPMVFSGRGFLLSLQIFGEMGGYFRSTSLSFSRENFASPTACVAFRSVSPPWGLCWSTVEIGWKTKWKKNLWYGRVKATVKKIVSLPTSVYLWFKDLQFFVQLAVEVEELDLLVFLMVWKKWELTSLVLNSCYYSYSRS